MNPCPGEYRLWLPIDAQLQEGLAEVARIDVDAYECDDTEEQDPVADEGVIEGID